MFDTTLLVVTRLMCDHYMGTSGKDEMYSLIYKSNITSDATVPYYWIMSLHVPLWNNYICTEKQQITLLIYKSTICTSSTYHVWRQISTWNNIIMPYWLQRVPQSSISNLVRQGSPLHPPKHHHLLHNDSSMKGLRAHTGNLKVSVLWTPSQAQNHSKTTTASESPSSGPLEFGSNGSEIVSFRLNQTTPQQWLTNRMVARCTDILLHWPKRYWCQPGNTTS